MAVMNTGIDLSIRKIPADEAIEMTPRLWAKLKSLPHDDVLPQSQYIEIFFYTARRILIKMEETAFSTETWRSYTNFFMRAIVAYGTADMKPYLRIAERLLTAVLGFPSGAQPLLREYLNCAASQSTQRNAEIAMHLAKHPTSGLPQVERQPDLEYDGSFVACIEAKPASEAMKILEELPSQLTFAHRHSIMHLKLCNPLPIPPCAYVSTGYCCDTCHLRGIRVGFQAMLYDEEGSGDADSAASVRSEAQISRKKTYGFDVCTACAVTFYAQQRDYLFSLLRFPHRPYSFGHVAGVHISQVCYHAQRRAVQSTCSSLVLPLSRHHSETEAKSHQPLLPAALAQDEQRLSEQSALASSNFPSKQEPGDVCTELSSSNSSYGSSSSFCADATPAEKIDVAASTGGPVTPKWFPPVRPPSRRMSSSTSSPPSPPASRCAVQDVVSVTLTVTLAPYGARPIAWVLGCSEKFVHLNMMEDMLLKRLGPASQWRQSVKMKSTVAMRRLRTSAAALPAQGAVATHADAFSTPAGLIPAPHGRDSPRTLMNTLSPLQVKNALNDDSAFDDHSSTSTSEEEEDACAICLCPFDDDEPVIETLCHHWFHVNCIEKYTRIAEDVCPLCRAEHMLPDMSRATALKNNAYKMELELTEEQRQQPYVDVCVGSVITRDGNYRNATSIAAAQCVRVYPKQLQGYQVKSPVKAAEAHLAAKT